MQTTVATEGDPAFPATPETDNSVDSSPESNEPEQTPSSEEDKDQAPDTENALEERQPLNEHPRWKQREDDWKDRFNKQEERHLQEMAALRQEIQAVKKPAAETPTKVPEWFGGDEKQWESFQKWNQDLAEQKARAAVDDFKSKTAEQQKAIDDATQYFNDTVAAIESDKDINPEGQEVDRNKLLKFTMDNDLVDSKGRWNYRAAYQLMRSQEQSAKDSKLQEKKQIAGVTTSEKKPESKPKDFMTSDDFSNPAERPW